MPTPHSTVRFCVVNGTHPLAAVEVQVVRDLPPADVDAAEAAWQPVRRQLAAARQRAGRDPEHAHWDWAGKLDLGGLSRWRFVGVRHGSSVEGLMAVRTKFMPSRRVSATVLYVDYIEVAPWNSRDLTDAPRLGGVGTHLLTEAVVMSVNAGLGGRVSLSALPQAGGFYQRLGMIMVDPGDPDYDDLAKFEFDEVGAQTLLQRHP